MLEFLGSLLQLAGKILLFYLIVKLIFMIMKKGKGTIQDLLDTIMMAMKVMIQKIQIWLFDKYKEPRKEEQGSP